MEVVTKYLLPCKALHMEQLYDRKLEFKKSLRYEVYDNAYILPYKSGGYGGVLTQDKEYVSLSAGPELECKPYEVKDVKTEECTVVYGGAYIGHFGHFLTDTNLRSWILQDEIWKSVDYIVFTRASKLESIKKNCIEFWELLGIYDKVRILDEPMRFSRVVVPECGYWNGIYYSEPWLGMFAHIASQAQKLGLENHWKKCNSIFLSRRKFAKREFGHREIDRFWKNNGYKIIYPEKYSLKKLIYLLYNSDNIAGISGTVMHHLLFCENGKKIFICERYYPINELQIDINIIKDVHVTYIDSNICIFPTYIGNTPAIVCYNDYFDKFAMDQKMKRMKKLSSQPVKYRKYVKKYSYEWGKNGRLDVEEKYMEERQESYNYSREYYGWLEMRPGNKIIRFVKKIMGLE